MIESSEFQKEELFLHPELSTEFTGFVSPKTYTGLAGFHKYWGKKPIESISFLINKCTNEGEIVLDPFLGSGLITIECLQQKRRIIGIDINPFSYEHATFLLNLPSKSEYKRAVIEIENMVSEKINSTYLTLDGQIASHYLWNEKGIDSVWIKSETGRIQSQNKPSEIDLYQFATFQDYEPRYFRDFKFFKNSRINVDPTMSVHDIFTGRAIRNIDLLIDAISKYPPKLKRALLITLTSAVGQMSNMVFAIKNRRKDKDKPENNSIEVGSWVIGFWLPETRFEVNVWNCFKIRANKLLRTLPEIPEIEVTISSDLSDIKNSECKAWLVISDCRDALKKIPSDSISFVCTDPPHSDRIPYLELSELWNSILGYEVDFDKEIVVSNARERNKTKTVYNSEMTEFFIETTRILKPDGFIAVYFNARDEESWKYLMNTSDTLRFVGCFPIEYSATSVVQDNRKGAMKSDYVLLYTKHTSTNHHKQSTIFSKIPGWSTKFPKIIKEK